MISIGDTPVTDYFGAKKAGWYALLIHDSSPETLRKKYGDKIEDHHVYQSILDLHKDISKDYIKW